MVSIRTFSVSLIGVLAILFACALIVSAADTEPPEVVGPEPKLGAEVVWVVDREYTLDSTGSFDDTGIVRYGWEIQDQLGISTSINGTSSTETWTPTTPGIYRVQSWAEDAAGNRGWYVYAIDVAVVVPAGTVTDSSLAYDHSIVIESGDFDLVNTDITMSGGRKSDVGASSGQGEQITEDVKVKAGALSGYWTPYYPDDSYYGYVYKDTNEVLVGKASIRNSGGSYQYGWRYYFDKPADLSDYDHFVLWYQTGYYAGYGGYINVYSDSGYGYCYQYYNRPGSNYDGWVGVSYALNWYSSGGEGYYYDYGVDWKRVTYIVIYCYSYQYPCYVDGAYFEEGDFSDNITDSTSPSGDWSGYWSGVSLSSFHKVGRYSLYTSGSGSKYMYYYWDNYVDLSKYDAIRFYAYITYYYGYKYSLYMYDSSGRYAYVNPSGYSTDYLSYYAWYYNDNWGANSYPFDKENLWYVSSGFDWTSVRYMRLELYLPSSASLYIDGFEFLEAVGSGGGAAAPVLEEDIPVGIYTVGSGSLSMKGGSLSYVGELGTFMRSAGGLDLDGCTLSGLYGWEAPDYLSSVSAVGGVMAEGGEVTIKNVKVTDAAASAFYLVNCNVTVEKLEISGLSATLGEGAILVVDISGGVDDKTVYDINLKDCQFKDNPGMTGFLINAYDAIGGATITLDDVRSVSNSNYGGIISFSGYYGPVSIDIVDSLFSNNGGSGLQVLFEDAYTYQGDMAMINLEGVEAYGNGGNGIDVSSITSDLEAKVTIRESYIETNYGDGLYVTVKTLSGHFTVDIGKDTILSRNYGNGIYLYNSHGTGSGKPDIDDRTKTANADPTNPVGLTTLLIDGASINNNNGNGYYEYYTMSGVSSGQNQPHMLYNMKMTGSTVRGNSGRGIYVYSPAMTYSHREANYLFKDCEIVDNGNEGFYAYDDAYAYYPAQDMLAEYRYNFVNCSIEGNYRGISTYFYNGVYGMRTFYNIEGCTIIDNSGGALYAYGYYSSSTYYSYMASSDWTVRNSTLDGLVFLQLSGAYSLSGYHDPYVSIVMEGNTYKGNDPIYLHGSAYYYDQYQPMMVDIVYRNNVHTSTFFGDALDIEALGGTMVVASVLVEDCTFANVMEDGVDVLFGTQYSSTGYRMSATGSVEINNVTFDRVTNNAMLFKISHKITSGALTKARFNLVNVTVDRCSNGLYADTMQGELHGCTFTNIRDRSIISHYSIIDVFDSEVGEVDETNLFVDLMGAIRMWYDLTVHAKWMETGDVVRGANIELKDNSWDIKGVNTISGPEGVRFANINTHTILADGVFTKNPFIVRAEFKGLAKEETLVITGHTSYTIIMRDDVAPRLYIEAPKEPHNQREATLDVKGTAYDLHTAIDRVMVSIDNVNWFRADGIEVFTYTVADVPEGISVVRVRAYDTSGNVRERRVTVFVDKTPPSLGVTSPVNGTETRFRDIEVVGLTDIDAIVYINSQPIDLEYTLISHMVRLSEGLNEIKITAYDNIGNSVTVVRTVTLDTHSPYIEMLTDDQVTREQDFVLRGLTETENVVITMGGKQVPVDYRGRFEISVRLVTGKNVFAITGVDRVGNTRTLTTTVILDDILPWFRVDNPSAAVIYDDRNVLVSGYAEAGAQVYVNDREVEVLFGQFSTYINVPEGKSDLTILVVDAAGNTKELVVPIWIDTVAPVIDLETPVQDAVTNSGTILVRGYIQDPSMDFRDISLFVNDLPWPIDNVEGRFIGEVSLEEGYNRVILEATDAAGNVGTKEVGVVLDSKAPFLDVKLQGVRMDPQWNEPVALRTYVYVTGFTEIGSTPMVNGVYMKVDPETGYFNHTVDIPRPLPGMKIYALHLEVTSTDEAGNVASDSLTVNRIEGVSGETAAAVSTAEWLVLFLAIVILAIALVGALAYQRMAVQEDVIVAYETRPATVVVTEAERPPMAPPKRPARGGVPRKRTPSVEEKAPEADEEDEVVLDLGDSEVE